MEVMEWAVVVLPRWQINWYGAVGVVVADSCASWYILANFEYLKQ